jgi:Leucine-rich repeat (LRR) protein
MRRSPPDLTGAGARRSRCCAKRSDRFRDRCGWHRAALAMSATALTWLDLSGSQVMTLPSLDKLTALTTLNLDGSLVTTQRRLLDRLSTRKIRTRFPRS